MTDLREALQYLMEEQALPYVNEIDGEVYSDRKLYRISHNPKAEPISMNTLSSLVDYIKANIDDMKGEMIIHVKSATKVSMYSKLDDERIRECIAEVNAKVPSFSFNHFHDHEEFIINMQSKFLDTDDKKHIQRFAGTVENGTLTTYGDDGVTQKAVIKEGVASKSDTIVPNPVTLKAYRTFVEVEQPESDFIFRLRQGRVGEIQCALFEADGGAWEIAAMKKIKEYLEFELEGVEGFIVIS